MFEYFQEHQILFGLITGMLIFVLQITVRLVRERKRIPRHILLEWTLDGAAMAIRSYYKSCRLLYRGRLLAAAGGRDNRAVTTLLRKAAHSAETAVSGLRRTLNAATKKGCPAHILISIGDHLSLARAAVALLEVPDNALASADVNVPPRQLIKRYAGECQKLVAQTFQVLIAWEEEIDLAKGRIKNFDPVIVRTQGVFRTPFKKLRLEELDQTRVVIVLTRSIEDFNRLKSCITRIEQACNLLLGSDPLKEETSALDSDIISALNDAISDAKSALPSALVSGETLTERPGEARRNGFLQRLYENLCLIEASAKIS